jgi:membrane protein YdbS with pleckstrin-like domain
MDSQWIFVLKLLVISAVIAAAIKYVVPFLQIPATATVALVFVLSPTILMAGALAWRRWQFDKQQDKV